MTRRTQKNERNEGRRNLIKAVAAGGGVITGGAFLPTRWTKPVVDAVLLPAHAQTSLIGCEAVFCGLEFNGAGIFGAAEVRNGNLIMAGGSEAGDWGGSGPVAPDGSFSIVVEFESTSDALVTGFVEGGCLRIRGVFDFSQGSELEFFGSANDVPSIDSCFST